MIPLVTGPLLRDAIRDAGAALGREDARLEAEVLLMHALQIDRARLYQRLGDPLTSDQAATFAGLVARRATHEPLAYITGHREFFGLDFETTPAALIPRPETETLVELAISFARERFADRPITIADIGTGSGVIAVSLAASLQNVRVIATDLSPDALALARRNAARHNVSDRIDFRAGDLFEPFREPAQIVAANLPYVTTGQLKASPLEIRDHEPRLALDGGTHGLDAIRRLFVDAPAHLASGGALFCEIGALHGDAARELARQAFPQARLEVARDLAGHDRVLCVYVW